MRNTLKASTLESKFPLLSVEHGCIVSKDADITVGFRVELPELYTVTSAEYEAIHATWVKAMKVLPDYCIVHKQDIFIRETYKPDTDREDMSFLSRSFERHFNERPYLNHYCYLSLTKTTKERSRTQSNFSTLCRGFIVPKEIKDKEAVTKFLESVGQFASILNESGYLGLRQLTDEEITGTDTEAGIIEKYFSLSQTDTTTLEDITLKADEMKIGDNYLCLHTLSDVEDLPGEVATDSRYEKLSTDRSDCRLSFAAPIGLLLPCKHIYNQYVFIDDSAANLQKFEKMAKNMHSLSRYSRSNQINKEWIDEYLNEAHSFGLTSVRCHCNVMAWSDDREELKRIRNEVGSQLAQAPPQHRRYADAFLGCHSRQCRRFSGRGKFLHVHRAGGLFLLPRNELPELAVTFRHQDGGQADGKAAASGYFRPADEKGNHHEQKQIRIGAERFGKILFHEPPCPPILRAGHARGFGRYG